MEKPLALVLQCPNCRTGFDIESNCEAIYIHEDEGLYGKTFVCVDSFECEDCKKTYDIKFELASIIEQIKEGKDEEEDENEEEVEKLTVTKHCESMDELYAYIKTLEKTELSEDEKEYINITVVTVISTDDDYPYAVKLSVCLDDYKDVFRTNIFHIDREGMLVDILGDAGEYEFDPLDTIEECIDACLEIADEWFE